MNTPPDDASTADPQRRNLLLGALAVPAALAVTSVLGAAPSRNEDPLRNLIVVNSLGALFDPEAKLSPEQMQKFTTVLVTMHEDLITERSLQHARDAGMTAVNVTVGYVDGAVDPFDHTIREIARWNRIFERHRTRLIKVQTTQDIVRAKRENKIGTILGFQNGVMVGDDASRVEMFADLGIRVFQLTYNKATQLGDGSIAPENRGLTRLGREVIEWLNQCRVISDLSHSGQNTCLEAIGHSKRPITISHTGCRALADLPRNKTDEELRGVAEKGGYVGIYFMPFLRTGGPVSSEDLIAHLEHALNVCGEDHVGIGTDSLVSPMGPPEETIKNQKALLESRRNRGISAPGEEDDVPFYLVDMNGPDQFRQLVELLSKRGHPWTRIEKIMGRNFMRVAREVWGA